MSNTNKIVGSPKNISKFPTSSGLASAHSSPSQMQSSSRISPDIRPRSPLSPRHEVSTYFDPLRPPSPRTMASRSAINQRRGNSNPLKLPSLPRYHPSNYTSAHSSLHSTPDSGYASPQAPMSPRSHQRVISDAQKHLLAYQRETVSAAARSSTPIQFEKPDSPRLVPLGSPGPVTPLQLEEEGGGYFSAAAQNSASDLVQSQALMERLMREETARQPRATRQAQR